MKDLPIGDNGESNALFVGSYKDRKNKVTIVQGESKKMSVKEMFDFLTLKMLPLIGSGVDQNKKLPSL